MIRMHVHGLELGFDQLGIALGLHRVWRSGPQRADDQRLVSGAGTRVMDPVSRPFTTACDT